MYTIGLRDQALNIHPTFLDEGLLFPHARSLILSLVLYYLNYIPGQRRHRVQVRRHADQPALRGHGGALPQRGDRRRGTRRGGLARRVRRGQVCEKMCMRLREIAKMDSVIAGTPTARSAARCRRSASRRSWRTRITGEFAKSC